MMSVSSNNHPDYLNYLALAHRLTPIPDSSPNSERHEKWQQGFEPQPQVEAELTDEDILDDDATLPGVAMSHLLALCRDDG
jgi:hypothetical protein